MNNLDEQYRAIIADILENGTVSGDRTGTGTKKVFGRMITHDMKEGFPLLTTKKMFWKGILVELLWFLRGDTNIKYLVDNGVNIWVGDCYKRYKTIETLHDVVSLNGKILDATTLEYRILTEKEFIQAIKDDKHLGPIGLTFSQAYAELGTVYGKEWVDWYGINQVQEVLDSLKNNPDNRRMMVTAWNPVNVKKAVLPPCHYAWQVFTRELTFSERLNLIKTEDEQKTKMIVSYCEFPGDTWLEGQVENILTEYDIPVREISIMFQMRSVDMPLGFPFDIASYAFLLSMIAQVVNMVPGKVSCSLGDTHIYVNQIDAIKEQISREPYLLPMLELNKDIKNLFDFRVSDVKINDYRCHDKIYIPLSN